MFSVCDHLGDIQTSGLGEQGLFSHGTRHLSEFALCLWKARPLLFSSAIKANNFLFTANLSNPDVSKNDSVAIPRGTLHLQRSKFLWRDVSYEEFAFINYGLSSLLVPFGLRFDADFADIFEVRGMHRHTRGQRLEDRVEKDLVQLSYKGLDGTIRRTSVQSDFVPQKTTASGMIPIRRYCFLLSAVCALSMMYFALNTSAGRPVADRQDFFRLAARFRTSQCCL
jgi:glycogen debranching enzyme